METVFVRIADSVWVMSKDKHHQLLRKIFGCYEVKYEDYGIRLFDLQPSDIVELTAIPAYNLMKRLYD